jgi:hypothetical protein
MKFSVFLQGDCNYHVAGWRHPDSYVDSGTNLQRWVEYAQILERAKMDMLFIADTIGVPGADRTDLIGYNTRGDSSNRLRCYPRFPLSPSQSASSRRQPRPTTSRIRWPGFSPRSII